LDEGEALERFGAMVEAQGGDARVVEDPWSVLPVARVRAPVAAPEPGGFLAAVDAEALGRAATALGAGRMRKADPIDPSVGLEFDPEIGDGREAGERIGVVHAADEGAARRAADAIRSALTWSERPIEPPPLLHGWVD
jgi:thymidine phosphorylase